MCVQRLWGLNPLRDQKAACRQIEIWSFPALQVSMCMCVSKSERMWKEADPDTYLALPPWLLHVHGASQCRDGVQLRDLWSDSLSCGCPCVCGHRGGGGLFINVTVLKKQKIYVTLPLHCGLHELWIVMSQDLIDIHQASYNMLQQCCQFPPMCWISNIY